MLFFQYLGSHAVKTITGLQSTVEASRKMRVRQVVLPTRAKCERESLNQNQSNHNSKLEWRKYVKKPKRTQNIDKQTA